MIQEQTDIPESLIRLLFRLQEISIRDFSVLNETQMRWRSEPGKWSIAECFRHISALYTIYIPILENSVNKAVRPVKSSNSFKSGLLGYYLIRSVQIRENNSIKKRLKCPSVLRPDKTESFFGTELMDHFYEMTNQIISILEQSKKVNIEKEKAALPFFPYFRLRLGDMFMYLVYHVERHVVQAQKLHMDDNFPRQNT